MLSDIVGENNLMCDPAGNIDGKENVEYGQKIQKIF